jgi:hypothetical protein
MNRMFKLTLALLAVLALTGSALAQISEWHGGTVDKKGTSRFANYGGAVRSGFLASVEDKSRHRRYLSVI